MKRSTPFLDTPGAGLPALELFIVRRRFAFLRRRGNRESFIAKIESERSAIQELLKSSSSDQRNQPVLIRRPRGLEDSSRNWSVWMTLDHLRITNLAFANFIKELSEGTVPDLTVSTADVKPDPEVTEKVEKEFQNSCDALLAVLANTPKLQTEHRFAHPWFGPLDAFGWLALAALHLGIHRGQLTAILRGLPA